MVKNFSLTKAIILVFFASACTMVIELIAGRILAPYIGVSLYTWTSIIGIVLAGISLGNYLGGKVGDKLPSPLVLSVLFFAGSILSLAILPMTILLKTSVLPVTFHIMSRATIYAFVLFFLPTTVLGMVTPIVIKLTLKDLGKTANVAGTIYAISCVGSILGTFLTGFLLISWFGTRMIVWQVAGVLFLMALFCSGFWRSKVKLSLAVATLIIFSIVFQYRSSFQLPYIKESNYYTINVFDTRVQGRSVKALSLDHLVHSYVDLNDPTFHGYNYEKTFASVASYIAREKADIKVLLIGGGGYSFARYMEVTYPKASIEVVEIDPAVTEIAYSRLALPATSRIVTHNRDARIFLIDRKTNNRYDLVVGDTFNDMSVPYHLTTFEFNEEIKDILEADGFYIVNLVDNLREGRFVRSLMKTLNHSFKHVYLFLPDRGWGVSGTSTHVVIATNRKFSSSEFISFTNANAKEFSSANLVTLDEIEQALGKNRAILLTDDYTPVDNMIAPLFTTR